MNTSYFKIIPVELYQLILSKIKNESMVDDQIIDPFKIITRIKLVSHEFKINADENIKNRNLHPLPKFKNGQLVIFNDKKQQEIRDNVKVLQKTYGHAVGEQPYGRLIIYGEPSWNAQLKQWIYAYEYGIFGDHEGFANEDTLLPYNNYPVNSINFDSYCRFYR